MLRHLIVTCALVSLAATARADTINVIVMAGQSNMVGGATIEFLPGALQGPQEHLFQYRLNASDGLVMTDDWIGLQGRTKEGSNDRFHSSEITFGYQVGQILSGERFAFIKVAGNGTNLIHNWNPAGTDNLYDKAISFVNQATDQLVNLGHQVEMAGFIWVQGSADAGRLDRAQAYDENFTNLIQSLRSEWGEPDLPVVFNQYHADSARSYTDELRASQANVAAADPRVVMVNMDDLSLRNDSIHFTNATHQELGYRLADAFLSTQLLPGDLDGDGDVDNFDILKILLANSFENSAGGPYHWAEGDTNGDQVVNWLDIQNILRTGAFGARLDRAQSISTPEPSSLLLAIVAIVILGGVRWAGIHARRIPR